MAGTIMVTDIITDITGIIIITAGRVILPLTEEVITTPSNVIIQDDMRTMAEYQGMKADQS
jgi:hypothetical protein